MTDRSETEKFTLRVGRQYAVERGITFVSAFNDTLSGDLARLEAARRLRRAFPGISSVSIDQLVEELLTP
jgi:hypothetical protein